MPIVIWNISPRIDSLLFVMWSAVGLVLLVWFVDIMFDLLEERQKSRGVAHQTPGSNFTQVEIYSVAHLDRVQGAASRVLAMAIENEPGAAQSIQEG